MSDSSTRSVPDTFDSPHPTTVECEHYYGQLEHRTDCLGILAPLEFDADGCTAELLAGVPGPTGQFGEFQYAVTVPYPEYIDVPPQDPAKPWCAEVIWMSAPTPQEGYSMTWFHTSDEARAFCQQHWRAQNTVS
jgi:hypothetical protein